MNRFENMELRFEVPLTGVVAAPSIVHYSMECDTEPICSWLIAQDQRPAAKARALPASR